MAAATGKRKEPAVISVALLVQALEEEERDRVSSGAGAAAAATAAASAAAANGGVEVAVVAKPPTALGEARSLGLSYKGLLKVENLQLLTRLQRLRLDNNSLTRIEGLEPCVHLEWLDLSFNKLRVVEGIGHLSKLRDLSLYNNEISSVDGLLGGAAAASLQVLSLGNNLLLKLEDTVIKLRGLRALEVVTLEGNPLCKPAEGQRTSYRSFCHGFLPRLKYLDYAMVTAAEKSAARDGGVPAELLQEVEDMDTRDERARGKAAERTAFIAHLAAMNIEVVETLLDTILDEDPDFAKVRPMPGMPQLVQSMREAIAPAAATLRESGAAKDAGIHAEIAQFDEALAAVTGESHASTAARLTQWERSFKHVSREAEVVAAAVREAERHRSHAHAAAAAAAGYPAHLAPTPAPQQHQQGQHLHGASALAATVAKEVDALLSEAAEFEAWAVRLELETHESVEAMLDAYDTSMVELRAAKVASHESFFRALEAAEGVFSETLLKHAEKVVADFAKGKVPVEDADLVSLLGDKEALLSTLGQAHETRVARILKSEAELKTREERRCGGAVLAARHAELARNRGRVFEIKEIAKTCAKRSRELLH